MPRVISNAMRPRCFSSFHLPVSFRGPASNFLAATQAASQLSRTKIRKLLYHHFQSGGFLLVMYNRRDRRVIPSRNSGGTFHPHGKRCHDALDLFSSRPLFYHKFHYVTRFFSRFVVQTPPKKVPQNEVFSTLYPRFSNIVFPPAKIRLYTSILRLLPPLCKGHLSIFDLCWGDFTTPPFYYIGHLFKIFNYLRGSAEGKTPFLHPVWELLPSLLRRELGNDHRRSLFHRARKQAIKTPPPQSPTRIHISHLINPNNWTYSLLSYRQTQGFMAAQRSCFIKQGKPAVAFRTIVRRRTRGILTSDQALCQSGISKEKAASKADSVPPMSHPMQ